MTVEHSRPFDGQGDATPAGSAGARLLRLAAVVPLAFLALFIGLYGLMVFASGFTRDYYDSDPAVFVVIGIILMVVAALLAGSTYFIATNGRHTRGWLAITTGAVVLAVTPLVLLIAGALRGGASLFDAIVRNVRQYVDVLDWGGTFGRAIVVIVVLLGLGSATAYLVSRRPIWLELFRRSPHVFVGLLTVTGLAVFGVWALSTETESDTSPQTSGGTERSEAVPTVAIVPTAEMTDRSQQGSGILAFTDADREAAVELALGSQQVRQLVGDGQIRSAEPVQWHSGPEPVGSAVTLELARPATIDGKWVSIDGSSQGQFSYDSDAYRAEYENVTELLVFVDLREGVVAGVEPGPTSGYHTAGLLEWVRVAVQRVLLELLPPLWINIMMVLSAVGVLGAIIWLSRLPASSPELWLAVTTVCSLTFFLVFLQTGGTVAPMIGYPLQIVVGALTLWAAMIYVTGRGASLTNRPGV